MLSSASFVAAVLYEMSQRSAFGLFFVSCKCYPYDAYGMEVRRVGTNGGTEHSVRMFQEVFSSGHATIVNPLS